MKLLTTSTARLELHEFFGDELEEHPYAILSHTWGKDEVLFGDITKPGLEQKLGYQKLASARQQAQLDGYQYIWIDTCCIDKGSSAELTEAINSMYQWYENAKVCYAYLEDVSTNQKPSETRSTKFDLSRWFTRGWTLQELIAPRNVKFYSSSWTYIGSKMELCTRIFAITGIDPSILTGADDIDSASIARRMSWAAYRRTTRLEDRAYSLMGIFRVKMPMLYGEGPSAFLRLQQEIIKISNDQTLFAWCSQVPQRRYTNMFADSPSAFRNAASMVPLQSAGHRQHFSVSSKGLSIDVRLHYIGDYQFGSESHYAASLNCMDLASGRLNERVTIILVKKEGTQDEYFRRDIPYNQISLPPTRISPRNVHIDYADRRGDLLGDTVLVLREGPCPNNGGFRLCRIDWDEQKSTLQSIYAPEQNTRELRQTTNNLLRHMIDHLQEGYREWVPSDLPAAFIDCHQHDTPLITLHFKRNDTTRKSLEIKLSIRRRMGMVTSGVKVSGYTMFGNTTVPGSNVSTILLGRGVKLTFELHKLPGLRIYTVDIEINLEEWDQNEATLNDDDDDGGSSSNKGDNAQRNDLDADLRMQDHPVTDDVGHSDRHEQALKKRLRALERLVCHEEADIRPIAAQFHTGPLHWYRRTKVYGTEV